MTFFIGLWPLSCGLCFFFVGCDNSSSSPPVSQQPSSFSSTDEEAQYRIETGDVELRYDRHDLALQHFQAALKLTKNPHLIGRATYGLYLVSLEKGDRKAAVAHLVTSIEQAPRNGRAELLLKLAQLHQELGDRAAAETALQKVGDDPRVPLGTRNLAYSRIVELHKQAGTLDAFIGKLEQRVLESGSIDALSILAQIYKADKKDPKKAIETYEKLLARDPKNLAATLSMIELSEKENLPDKGKEWAEALLRLTPRDPSAYLRSALYFAHFKEFDRALELARKAESLAPDTRTKFVQRLETLKLEKQAGKLAERIAALEKTAAGPPPDAETLQILTLVYGQVEPDDEKLLTVARTLRQLLPDDPSIPVQIAGLCFKLKKYEDCATVVEGFLKENPAAAAPTLNVYGESLIKLQQEDRGIPILQPAAEGEPVLRVPALALLSILHTRKNRSDEAAKCLTRMIEAARELASPDAYLTALSALVTRRMFAEALPLAQEALQTVTAQRPRSELLMLFVDILEGLKRLDEAARICSRMEKDPALDTEVRQWAQRRALAIYQKQGKDVDIKPKDR